MWVLRFHFVDATNMVCPNYPEFPDNYKLNYSNIFKNLKNIINAKKPANVPVPLTSEKINRSDKLQI